MLIHLFGFPSSGGLGAGYDSSPQASSCTCELKWSVGGQRRYCGGRGRGKNITFVNCRTLDLICSHTYHLVTSKQNNSYYITSILHLDL